MVSYWNTTAPHIKLISRHKEWEKVLEQFVLGRRMQGDDMTPHTPVADPGGGGGGAEGAYAPSD